MTSIFGSITSETPKFEVLHKYATYELRQYARQLRATYTYPIPEGSNVADGLGGPFRALAGYIFGGNEKAGADGGNEKIAMTAPVVTQRNAVPPASEKIAMTAPVVTQKAACGTTCSMSFILPSKYTSLEELPKPKNADVTFDEVPPAKVVAIHFNGTMKYQLADKEAALRSAAAADGLKLSSAAEDVQYCQFNPPWCLPAFRTNEIAIKVVD